MEEDHVMRTLMAIVFIVSLFFWTGVEAAPVAAQTIPASQMISVRVDSKPLNVEYIVIADEVFVPAEEMRKVFDNSFTWDPGTLWVSIGNKETPVKGLQFQDRVFLPLRGMAMQFGYTIDWDSSKSILNIKTGRAVSEQKTVAVEKPAAAGGEKVPATAGKQTAGDKNPGNVEQQPAPDGKTQGAGDQQTTALAKQPVEDTGNGERRKKAVTISLFKEDPIVNVLEQVTALRVYADVKNGRNRPLKNVVAHCTFRYPEGEVFFEDTVTIDTMEPGEIKRVIFYTINPVQVGKLKYDMTVQVQRKTPARND